MCPVLLRLLTVNIQSWYLNSPHSLLEFSEKLSKKRQPETSHPCGDFQGGRPRRPVFTSGCKRVFVSLPLGTEKALQTESCLQHPMVPTVLEAARERQACQNAKETQKALAEAIPDHSGPNSAEMRCFSENNF